MPPSPHLFIHLLQNAVLELREQASELKAEKLRKESALNQMEIVLSQKNEEVAQLQKQIKRVSVIRGNSLAWQNSINHLSPPLFICLLHPESLNPIH